MKKKKMILMKILIYKLNIIKFYFCYFKKMRNEEEDFEIVIGDEVRRKIQARLKAKSKLSNGNLIQPIHDDILTRYNSVNVIVGKQSLGKTVIALEEIIKISMLDTHHLLIYVTKTGDENDVSFLTLKELLKIPYIVCSEKDAEACVNELIVAKNLYYTIRRERTKNLIDEEQKQELFEILHVENFEKEFLHTIILFDDISNSKLFSSEESFFSQQIRRCRHTNISYFLLIQGWKGLKPHVKNEITTLYLFPGFNKQQMRYIYSQAASNLEFDTFYEWYKELNKLKRQNPEEYPFIVIQVTDGGNTYLRT